jgi:hypothetical protein
MGPQGPQGPQWLQGCVPAAKTNNRPSQSTLPPHSPTHQPVSPNETKRSVPATTAEALLTSPSQRTALSPTLPRRRLLPTRRIPSFNRCGRPSFIDSFRRFASTPTLTFAIFDSCLRSFPLRYQYLTTHSTTSLNSACRQYPGNIVGHPSLPRVPHITRPLFTNITFHPSRFRRE